MIIKIHNFQHYQERDFQQMWIENGLIRNQEPSAKIDRVIDAKGATLFPGLVDMQVHLREPGGEHKEDIASGTYCAVAGGFVAVAAMPNTSPCLDQVDRVQDFQKRISEKAHCLVYSIPAMTYGLDGQKITDLKSFQEMGLLAITDDGVGVQDDSVMSEIFQKAKEHNLTIMQHCELFHADYSASQTEIAMIERDLKLLEKYGGHYHVLHLSTLKGLELIAKAKKKGLHVTCEVSPHHLLLNNETAPENNSNFKMNPPLRSTQDQLSMIQGLQEGIIDYIATDHAPHSEEEKNVSYQLAPNGIIGLETAFSVLYTELVLKDKLSLSQLIEKMSLTPQRIYQLELGQALANDPANFTLIDLNERFQYTREKILSKSKNSPFLNWHLQGKVKTTCVQGVIQYHEQ